MDEEGGRERENRTTKASKNRPRKPTTPTPHRTLEMVVHSTLALCAIVQ